VATRGVHLVSHQVGVGTSEVHELEDAQLRWSVGGGEQLRAGVALGRQGNHFTGVDFAQERSADDVKRR